MTTEKTKPPINEDIRQVWLQLSQIYQALNQVSHQLKALQAKEERTNGK